MRGILICTLLCFLAFSAQADGLNCQSLFSKNSNDLEILLARKKQRNSVFENSDYQLLRAVERVFKNDKTTPPADLPAKFYPLYSIKEVITIALTRRLQLDKELAEELAGRAVKDASESLKISWAEAKAELKINLDSKRLKEAVIQLTRIAEVDMSFQIPYLAGYSKDNPQKIYIDRGFSNKEYLKYLILHEATEKALLDELKLDSDGYLVAHQLAQRLEKSAVLNDKISWRIYQGVIMKNEIAAAENPKRILNRVPKDLDLTPYLDMKDFNLISKMTLVMKPSRRSQENKLFSVYEIAPGIHHLFFENKTELSKAMVRFQEHYESPEFRGKIFTRAEFNKWYRDRNDGAFDYYTFWADGFNFPSLTLEPFLNGRFKNLTRSERLILETFRNRTHENFYIIATAKDSETKTFEHEVAHALFYLNPKYKAEVLAILAKANISPVMDFLYTKYADYHRAVLLDEAHAWLMHNANDLKSDGLDILKYKPTIEKLRAVYKKHAPK